MNGVLLNDLWRHGFDLVALNVYSDEFVAFPPIIIRRCKIHEVWKLFWELGHLLILDHENSCLLGSFVSSKESLLGDLASSDYLFLRLARDFDLIIRPSTNYKVVVLALILEESRVFLESTFH